MKMTVGDVAEFMRVSEGVVQDWIETLNFPAQRIDGRYLVKRQRLLAWAELNRDRLDRNPRRGAYSPRKGCLLSEALRRGGVHLLKDNGPEEVWRQATYRLPLPRAFDRDGLARLLTSRCATKLTEMGGGIALPHPDYPIVIAQTEPAVSLWYLHTPLDLGACDGYPVDALFVIICPTVEDHFRLLTRLTVALQNLSFRAAVQAQASMECILDVAEVWEQNSATLDHWEGLPQ